MDVSTLHNLLLDHGISTVVSKDKVEFIVEIDEYRLVEVRKYKYYSSRNDAWFYGAINILKNLTKYLEKK